jgi:hypothetical protein
MASPAASMYLTRPAILHITVRPDGAFVKTIQVSPNADTDHWSRFVVKQTHEKLRPKRSFIRHQSKWEKLDLGTGRLPNPDVPIHGPQSIPHGWEWYEMGFFVHWTPHSTTILCFDLPEHLKVSLQSALTSSTDKPDFSNPYSVFPVLLYELLSLYDSSVWSIRNHICDWEAVSLYMLILMSAV